MALSYFLGSKSPSISSSLKPTLGFPVIAVKYNSTSFFQHSYLENLKLRCFVWCKATFTRPCQVTVIMVKNRSTSATNQTTPRMVNEIKNSHVSTTKQTGCSTANINWESIRFLYTRGNLILYHIENITVKKIKLKIEMMVLSHFL